MLAKTMTEATIVVATPARYAVKPENALKPPTGGQIRVLETIARRQGLQFELEVKLDGTVLTREEASTIIANAFEDGTFGKAQ